MPERPVHVVTGAFGYSGRYIARRLLDRGFGVRTLTHSAPVIDPFGGRVRACPFHFDQPDQLRKSLEGVSVLYNTYWVRFNHTTFRFAQAIENLYTLFRAAEEAGVRRIVHVSITNPSEDSPLEYFRGKALVEKALRNTRVSWAILRPAVLFGKEDILINNIAWMLRRFPVLGVFGDGKYRMCPIYVDDLAQLAVEQGQREENAVIDAIGPETFAYRDLVKTIAAILGKKRLIVSVPPWAGYLAGRALGMLVNDVVLTPDEIRGLMADLLYVNSPPAGITKLTDWAKQHAATLGLHYASELARRKGSR